MACQLWVPGAKGVRAQPLRATQLVSELPEELRSSLPTAPQDATQAPSPLPLQKALSSVRTQSLRSTISSHAAF